MYSTNLEMAAFLLSLFCLIYSLTVKTRQYIPPKGLKNKLINQHFVFLLLNFNALICASASIAGAYLLRGTDFGSTFWVHFFHTVYFIFHSALPICFALYIMDINGSAKNLKPQFVFLFSLPFALSEVLIMTNYFTDLVYFLDAQNGYHRGTLMVLLYAAGAFYVLFGMVNFIKHKQAIPRADRIAVSTVIIMAALGTLVQALRSDLLFELFFEALGFVVLMMLLEERGGHIDPLTGLLNRTAFSEANHRLLSSSQPYALVLVKLTNTGVLANLSSGRELDSLLLDIADFLKSISPTHELFYYRQESFAAILTGDKIAESHAFADQVIARFEDEWHVANLTLHTDAAVCVVKLPDQIASASQLEELLSGSYQNHKAGSHLVNYEEVLSLQKSKSIENALRSAIANGDLELYYQPIWSVKDERTVGAEALLRVKQGELKGVSPEVYIPIAEKSGLIEQIGFFVFEEVCRFFQNKRLRKTGISFLELNLSLYQFMDDDLCAEFEKIRKRYSVPVEFLNLEITESASASETPLVVRTMELFRSLGYGFSLDDFGTGYSNLVSLLQSNYKNVKIDKSILWDSDENVVTAKLLTELIAMIKRLGYNIIQEGVETKEQLERVTKAGCGYIQGFYFSRPLPEEEFLVYLENERKAKLGLS